MPDNRDALVDSLRRQLPTPLALLVNAAWRATNDADRHLYARLLFEGTLGFAAIVRIVDGLSTGESLQSLRIEPRHVATPTPGGWLHVLTYRVRRASRAAIDQPGTFTSLDRALKEERDLPSCARWIALAATAANRKAREYQRLSFLTVLNWVVIARNKITGHGGAISDSERRDLAEATFDAALELLNAGSETLFGPYKLALRVPQTDRSVPAVGLHIELPESLPPVGGMRAVLQDGMKSVTAFPWVAVWRGRFDRASIGLLNGVEAAKGDSLRASYLNLVDQLDGSLDGQAAEWLQQHLRGLQAFVHGDHNPDSDADNGAGRFELLHPLGEGGAGTVFLARDLRLGSAVALKVLKPDAGNDALIRFDRESVLLASGRHPGLVRVIDRGEFADGRKYLAMEFVDGADLWEVGRVLRAWREAGCPLSSALLVAAVDAIAERRRAGTSRAGDLTSLKAPENLEEDAEGFFAALARLFAGAAAALHELHSQNPSVVHRDIKPANLMVTRGAERLIVMDLGIAVRLDAPSNGRTLLIAGTPRYMAPEQLTVPPRVDRRADVYSLGVSLYELASLETPTTIDEPFRYRSRRAIWWSPNKESGRAPPGDLQRIIETATRLDASDRYRDSLALRNDLEAFADGGELPSATAGHSAMFRVRRLVRRHPRTVALMTASVILGIGLVGWASIANRRAWETRYGLLRALAGQALAEHDAGRAVAFLGGALRLRPFDTECRDQLRQLLTDRHWVRHQAAVREVQFSPDGTRFLTVSDDHTARIWDAVTGFQIVRLDHDAPVVSGLFTPDGTLVLTASGSTVRVFDARLGELRASVPAATGEVGWIKHLLDRKFEYCVRDRGYRFEVTDAGTIGDVTEIFLGRGLSQKRPCERQLRSVPMAWLPLWPRQGGDESVFAYFSTPRDRLMSRLTLSLEDYNRSLSYVAPDRSFDVTWALDRLQWLEPSPTGKHLAIARETGLIVLRTFDFRPLATEADVASPATTAAFSADGFRLISGHSDGSVRMWGVDFEHGRLQAWPFVNAVPTDASSLATVAERLTGVVATSSGGAQEPVPDSAQSNAGWKDFLDQTADYRKRVTNDSRVLETDAPEEFHDKMFDYNDQWRATLKLHYRHAPNDPKTISLLALSGGWPFDEAVSDSTNRGQLVDAAALEELVDANDSLAAFNERVSLARSLAMAQQDGMVEVDIAVAAYNLQLLHFGSDRFRHLALSERRRVTASLSGVAELPATPNGRLLNVVLRNAMSQVWDALIRLSAKADELSNPLDRLFASEIALLTASEALEFSAVLDSGQWTDGFLELRRRAGMSAAKHVKEAPESARKEWLNWLDEQSCRLAVLIDIIYLGSNQAVNCLDGYLSLYEHVVVDLLQGIVSSEVRRLRSWKSDSYLSLPRLTTHPTVDDALHQTIDVITAIRGDTAAARRLRAQLTQRKRR